MKYFLLFLFFIPQSGYSAPEEKGSELETEENAPITQNSNGKEIILPEEETENGDLFSPSTQTNQNKRRGGNRVREKEAEGTKAINQFDFANDSILRSKYRSNGKSLEVDPD